MISRRSIASVVVASVGAVAGAIAGAASARGDVPTAAPTAAILCPPGMLAVPGGSFQLGDKNGFPDETPTPANVKPFCLDRTEVTIEAYAECVRAGACEPARVWPEWSTLKSVQMRSWSELCNARHPERANHPVNCVEWALADRYCRAYGLHLPSELEWEFAARGGEQDRTYPWGEEPPSHERGNLCGAECSSEIAKIRGAWGQLYTGSDGWVGTAPVGSYPKGAGRWGHVDLSGNVCEWITGQFCPYGKPECNDHPGWAMVRGDHFLGCNIKKARAARRNGDDAWHRGPDVGFRCAADAGTSERRIVLTDRVPIRPELPHMARLLGAIVASSLVGLATGVVGVEALVLLLPIVMYCAQYDPHTTVSTVALASLLMLAAAMFIARRRRGLPSGTVAGPLLAGAGAAAAAAWFAQSLGDRAMVVLIVALLFVSALAIAIGSRRRAAPTTTGAPRPPAAVDMATSAAAGAIFGGFGISAAIPRGVRAIATSVDGVVQPGTVMLAAFAVALGTLVGAIHSPPAVAFALAVGVPGAVGAFVGIIWRSQPQRATRWRSVVLACAVLAGAVLLLAREILPAQWFPRL